MPPLHGRPNCWGMPSEDTSDRAPKGSDTFDRDEVRRARWTSTADVKQHYRSASIVSGHRIVFNIKSNDYRLVIAADFERGIVWMKWISGHAAYDRIDVRTVEYDRA